MNINRNVFISVVAAIPVLIYSCTDEVPKPPLSNTEFWNCHHEIAWNETQTNDQLIGVWDYIFTDWNGPNAGKDVSHLGLTVEFKMDSSLLVRVHDSILHTATWMIIPHDADLFAVETEPFVEYVVGRIMFCQDLVFFNASYSDLTDHYFRKRE